MSVHQDWETIGFRVVRSARAEDVSGFGSFVNGARWNEARVHALYVAETRSLAALESLVHNIQRVGINQFAMVEIRLPPGLSRTEYPESHCPSIAASRDFGTRWLLSHAQPLLRVPSAVVPGEWNWVINPQHPLVVQHIQTGLRIKPFAFDARFWRDGAE